MFPTDAAVRLEGLHPQITMRRMTTNMLRHLGAILVRAFRLVIAFAISTACIVFWTVMRPFKSRYRQVALPYIAPDEMNPCAKMSRQLETREFFDLWHRSYPCCIHLRNALGTDLWATNLPSLDSNTRIAGASLTDMSPGKGGSDRLRGYLKSSRVLLPRSDDHCVRLCIVLGDDEHLSPTGVYNANPSGHACCGTGNHPRSVVAKQENSTGLKTAQQDT
jgi:hypothetical protein